MSLPLSSEPRPSRWEDVRSREKRERASLVSLLPPRAGVSETPSRRQYEEPIVLWRMRRADGLLSHAVIGPRSNRAFVVWFVNGAPLGFRDFADWTSALRWSDQLQAPADLGRQGLLQIPTPTQEESVAAAALVSEALDRVSSASAHLALA